MSTATAPTDQVTANAPAGTNPNSPGSATAQGEPGPNRPLSHAEILKVMTGLLAGLFTALLSSTIVSTALPTIMSDLHGTQRQYTWVITSSLLALTVTTPIWGKLSDLFNKKLLVQLSIVLFVLGSIGAGFSQTVPPMMAFRAVQGVAMGGLTALTQSIIGSIIPPRQRGRYSGYMGAVMAVSTVSGPLLGGVITQHLDWRYCFFVCVPLAVVALFVLQKTLHLPTVKTEVHFDYLGAVLIAVAAALPMVWVTFAGSSYDWISWQSGLFLLVFAAFVAGVIVTELRARQPMVPIRVLKNSTTALMILASLGVGITLYGSSTFLTQYFQLAKGDTPTMAGLMTIPLIIAQMLSSTIGGQIVTRTGRWKPIMVFGSIVLLLGLGGMSTIDGQTPYWQLAIFMAVMGIGVGTLLQNIVLAVQNTVDVKDIGSSSATISFFRSLGGAVGVTVLGAVLADKVGARITDGLAAQGIAGGSGGGISSLNISNLPAAVQDIVHGAYGDTFGELFLIAGIIAIATLVAVIAVHEVPLRTTIELKPEAEQTDQAEQAQTAQAPTDQARPVRLRPRRRRPRSRPQHARVEDGARPSSAGAAAPAEHEVPAAEDLDDPNARLAVAAIDVLAAAQQQVAARGTNPAEQQRRLTERIDTLGRELDQLVARFHGELDQIRAAVAEPRSDRADNGYDRDGDQDFTVGVGGDHLRRYEYSLLLDSQQTAERVTRIARLEAERVLTEADTQRADLEDRIALLRKTEAELAERVQEQLKA